MKNFMILALLFFSFKSIASCSFYLEEDSVVHAGISLNYGIGITNILENKNYTRVYRADLADTFMHVSVETEQRKYFQYAVALIEVGDQAFRKEARCYTTNCAISDLSKVTNRAMIRLRKKLTPCAL